MPRCLFSPLVHLIVIAFLPVPATADIEVDIDVDVDRDGVVEDVEDEDREDEWSSTRGAIFLNNVDDDQPDTSVGARPDNTNCVIDGPDDLDDLAEIVLRIRTDGASGGTPAIPGATFASLRIVEEEQADRVRLFDQMGFCRLGRVGDESRQSYSVPLADWNGVDAVKLSFFVESLDFPRRDAKYLDLEFELHHSGTSSRDRVRLRVAPLLLLPNTQPAETVFFSWSDSNGQFHSDLTHALPPSAVRDWDFRERQDGTYLYEGDIWFQDEFEFGVTSHPKSTLQVVWDLPRDRGLRDLAEGELLGPGVGRYVLDDAVRDVSADYGGNIEVSFPVADFPFGRVITGTNLDPKIVEFLEAQEVQAPLIQLEVDWLAVQHVDEAMQVLGPGVVAVADTKLGMSTLQKLKDAGWGDSVLFEHLMDFCGYRQDVSVADLLSGDPGVSIPTPDCELSDAAEFSAWNSMAQGRLEKISTRLAQELGTTPTPVPVLFYPNWGRRSSAYVPNAVNGLVLDDRYLVPEPFGPYSPDGDALEVAITAALENVLPHGQVQFLDDWASYHLSEGEIHCGTNTQRRAFDAAWWEAIRDD